jgi:hypothetical protein
LAFRKSRDVESLSHRIKNLDTQTGKKMKLNLTKLIFIVCCSIVGFVGINFVACNFMVPGTINRANAKGELKNPPPLDCKESERRGYETLLAILTTVIALRTKVEED